MDHDSTMHRVPVAGPAPHQALVSAAALLVSMAAAQQPVPAAPAAEAVRPPSIRAEFTLPPLPLGAQLERILGHRVANDRGVLLSGCGSDLWHGPGDGPTEFWLLCDRGPNGLVTVDQVPHRTFLVPEYTPLILHAKAAAGQLEVLDIVPLCGASGAPVTGLPNLEGHDEVPYDATGRQRLPYCPSGLDTEGFVRLRDGSFWIAEEYGPSLAQVDPRGRVLVRHLPEGLALPGADYKVQLSLPAILAKRKDNRGFESLALSRDEHTLFVAVQSPLSVPDKATGDRSRLGRLLAFDLAAGRMRAEYAYEFEPAAAFDPSAASQSEMKISGLAVVDADTLLVLERTDAVARVYAVRTSKATDLLGSKWDVAATTPSLEAQPTAAAAGIVPLDKRLVVDLTALPGVPGKVEGIALVDEHTLAIANDNDFDVGTIDAAGNNVGKGARCSLWLIDLGTALR